MSKKIATQKCVRVHIYSDGSMELCRGSVSGNTIFDDQPDSVYPLIKTAECLAKVQQHSPSLRGIYDVYLDVAIAIMPSDLGFPAVGDTVAYVAKDAAGYQGVVAKVVRYQPGGEHVNIVTVDSNVSLLVPTFAITKVKVLWMDTLNPVDGEN